MKMKLHFHNERDIQVPENIKVIHDHGYQSVHVMDGPRRIVTGQVLDVEAEKEVIDQWVKQFPEVYRG